MLPREHRVAAVRLSEKRILLTLDALQSLHISYPESHLKAAMLYFGGLTDILNLGANLPDEQQFKPRARRFRFPSHP